MAVPVFSFIAAPQDQMLVLPNGAINPAWHRFFLQLPALMPKLAEATTTLDSAATSLAGRVTALEGNLGQAAVPDATGGAAVTALTISVAYDQTEVQALESRVRAYGAIINAQAATINTLIARLEAAGILEA